MPPADDSEGPSDITLRPFQVDDLPFFASLAQDPRVIRHVGDGHAWTPEQIDQRTQAALQQDEVTQAGAARWFVVDEAGRPAGRPVGLFTMTRREQSVEIGYWVAPRHWGRGIAGEMLGLGTAEVADLFGEQCVTARVAEGNIASTKALKRRGFEYLGEHNGLNVYSRCHESGCDQPGTAHSRAVVHLHRL